MSGGGDAGAHRIGGGETDARVAGPRAPRPRSGPGGTAGEPDPSATRAAAAPGDAPLASPPTTHLLYLHGFRSSPLSAKARRVGDWLAANRPDVRLWSPQLPPSPREAVAMLLEGTAGWPAVGCAVVGSSLGGFYASVVGEARPGWRVGVLNPAVDPARDLAAYIGEQRQYHRPEESFYFAPQYVDELRALRPPALTRPERVFAVIATGDELLDWREMHARYAGAAIRLVDGSDHALSDFDDHLPHLLRFLQLCD